MRHNFYLLTNEEFIMVPDLEVRSQQFQEHKAKRSGGLLSLFIFFQISPPVYHYVPQSTYYGCVWLCGDF